jgi:23S rRNA pseudouridine1911/1915/1917 synthase
MQPHNICERIIFENEYFIILNKPAQLLVHPTPRQTHHTLIQILQAYRPNTSLGLIHRLDRETSGLLLIAKNKITCGALGKMMETRAIKKKYAAIVHGIPEWNQLTVNAPIGFMGLSHTNKIYLRQTIKKQGAPATTHLKALQKGQRFSLILAEPITGRLHQIRVHLASLGHPIVGDKIYGNNPQAFLEFISKGWNQDLAQTLLIPRHALHAYQLSFPWLSELRQFSVDWEDDLIQFWHCHEPTSPMLPLIPRAIQ